MAKSQDVVASFGQGQVYRHWLMHLTCDGVGQVGGICHGSPEYPAVCLFAARARVGVNKPNKCRPWGIRQYMR